MALNNKKLVLGCAGFIGSALAEKLLRSGETVIGIDSFSEVLYPSQSRRARVQNLRSLGLDFVEEDLSTMELYDLFQDVDVIFNMAAVPGLAPSWTHFPEYVSSNLLSVENIVRTLTNFPDIFLVHASTSSVYGRVAKNGVALHPNSPYGVTKLAAENMIRAYSKEFGTKHIILRYFSVYGQNPRPDQFFAILIDRLLSNREIVVFGDGMNSRTYTYLEDVVEATIAAGTKKPDGLTLDISGNQSATTLDIIRLVSSALGREPRLRFDPPRKGDQRETFGNSLLAKEALGWSSKTSIEKGIEKMVGVL